MLTVDPGYPQGAPLHNLPVGVPLSCRFFMRGEPPHKNAACGYPTISAITSLYVVVQDVSKHNNPYPPPSTLYFN